MVRKIIPIISIALVSSLAIIFLIETNSVDRELLANTFVLDAIYYENEGFVEITFQDKTQKTSRVVLEILGMPESFQKNFNNSQFVERVSFSKPPQYGWKTNPVTLLIEHEELGQVGLKTEIHSKNESTPPIIYSKG